MRLSDFPSDIRGRIIPEPSGKMSYRCIGCDKNFSIDELLYVCPECRSVLMLEIENSDFLLRKDGRLWQRIFDYRKMLNYQPLKGIFRFYEFIAPVIPLDCIVYLGEGGTPLVEANSTLKKLTGRRFFFKNDGQNPSASFKDRGMACALSFINYWAKKNNVDKLLSICASTGDTSASAALYASYLEDFISSSVLLPHGKVTPQQLSQPLGSGARVIEIPGVFDDCMKVVETLSDNYHVALLNSKNSWRIQGQESYSYEICQDFDYFVGDKVVVLPIGNAGNITAVISGFLKFFKAGIISELPKIVGVQSEHADPVYRYYLEDEPKKRRFKPVKVRPSVAQAAMIGNPVSMPRVMKVVEEYNNLSKEKRIFVVQVKEQEIMDCMITANRNGNIVCTQGGESLAGFMRAINQGIVGKDEIGVLDSTAHMLKFISFQEMYFEDCFPPEFEVTPKEELKNRPVLVCVKDSGDYPETGKSLSDEEDLKFINETAEEIARLLKLKPKPKSTCSH